MQVHFPSARLDPTFTPNRAVHFAPLALQINLIAEIAEESARAYLGPIFVN